jgi:hypothetical protein
MKPSRCTLDCPVQATCGIYIGLEITSDKEGNIVSCNRRDFYLEQPDLNSSGKGL